jgi:serine/threonine protein kinase
MESSSDDEQYREANRILAAVLDLDIEYRRSFISGECKGDRALEKIVLRLLAISERFDSFLDDPPVTSVEIRPGDRLLDRFLILRRLGEGGMGSVFLAEDGALPEDSDRRQVALKMLRFDLRHLDEARTRFRAEIDIVRTVAHPNVCAILEVFADAPAPFFTPAPPFFTMEYCEGESLAHRIARGPVAFEDVMTVARGIAVGLDALHARGIVHRDLKPANIMLRNFSDGGPQPVIMDFGLAHAPESDPMKAGLLGSPDYMAPEQFRGSVTKAADIFAFGILLFEMIAGVRPYPKEELLQAALRRVCDDAPALSSRRGDVPEAWNRAIGKALHRDPVQRFASAGELIEAMSEG